MATTSCTTQFDLMMQLAQKRDSPAQIFDAPMRSGQRAINNNNLFEDLHVGGEDDASLPSRQQNLRQSAVTSSHGSNVGTPVQKMKGPPTFVKERLRAMQRLWSAMTKFVSSQCAQGRTVDLPLAGKFKRINSDYSDGKPQYQFMPHLDFVGSGHFKFAENAQNVSPFSKASVGFATSQCTVSLTSLGAVCNLDRESIAAGMKAIFIKFIEAARSGKYCKLDMRIGYIVAFPNGALQFENYADNSAQDEVPVDLTNDSRFVRRSVALGGSSAIQMDRKSNSQFRTRQSHGAAEPADKRSQSLHSSVKISRGGFSKLSKNTSIMTPYTNIGGEASRYGGKNRMLKQWYEGKAMPVGAARQLGYALNKRDLGVPTSDIYSQFSATNPEDLFDRARTQINASQAEAEMFASLKNNEFLPEVTFENFLSKKMNRGKRTLFLNKPTNEDARDYMKEYMQQSAARAQKKAEEKVNELEEQRLENQRVQEQLDELTEIKIEKKVAEQAQHRENIKLGVEERQAYEQIQSSFDKAYGFNDFPYTHGDDVERAQQIATKAWQIELTDELKKKGAIVNIELDDANDIVQGQNEDQLMEKASGLSESKQIESMLALQTKSLVLKNQVRVDRIDFKNKKQEALYNKNIQETPFYARKHKAVLFRPAMNDTNNQESVIKDARKRFEMDLMRSKQKEVEDEKELKALEDENYRFQMANDMKVRQERQAIREILNEQIQMDQLRKQIDKEDIQEKTETHFGPEEDNRVAKHQLNRKREMQNHLNSQLKQQMEHNDENLRRKLQKEKLTDTVNMGAVNNKLYGERMEFLDNRKQQISNYKGAWNDQMHQSNNKREVDKIVSGAVF